MEKSEEDRVKRFGAAKAAAASQQDYMETLEIPEVYIGLATR
jgi:hypothetical protein